jgi:hypothetical protein
MIREQILQALKPGEQLDARDIVDRLWNGRYLNRKSIPSAEDLKRFPRYGSVQVVLRQLEDEGALKVEVTGQRKAVRNVSRKLYSLP